MSKSRYDRHDRFDRSTSRGPRSLPSKRPYLMAMGFAAVHYLAILTALTLGVILIRERSPSISKSFVVAVSVVAGTWMWGYFIRTSTKCPLCKGTPLLDSGAIKHSKAIRIPPCNYGTTAQLSLIFTHRFRCMYCGTPFDLMKKPQSKD